MIRTRRLAAVATAAALTLALGACGDDDGGSSASSEEQPYVDAAAASLAAEEDTPFTEEESECVATLMVQTIGVDRLEEAGIEPADFQDSDLDLSEAGIEYSAEDQEAIANGLGDCVDVVDLFAESMAADGEVADEDIECMRDNVDEEQITALLASSFGGEEEMDEDSMSFIFELMAACPGLAGDMSGG
jgi:hypothetical protein